MVAGSRSLRPSQTDSENIMSDKVKVIQALREEREGYLRRGLAQRVAAVDEILAALGVRELAALEPEVEVASIVKAKRRKKTEDR